MSLDMAGFAGSTLTWPIPETFLSESITIFVTLYCFLHLHQFLRRQPSLQWVFTFSTLASSTIWTGPLCWHSTWLSALRCTLSNVKTLSVNPGISKLNQGITLTSITFALGHQNKILKRKWRISGYSNVVKSAFLVSAGARATSDYWDVPNPKWCLTGEAAALFLFYCTF